MQAKYTVSEAHQRIGIPLAHARGSDRTRGRKKVRKNWLAGESACPTEAQALARQRGTDAFVCQPGDLSDSLTASYGRGSDWSSSYARILSIGRHSRESLTFESHTQSSHLHVARRR